MARRVARRRQSSSPHVRGVTASLGARRCSLRIVFARVSRTARSHVVHGLFFVQAVVDAFVPSLYECKWTSETWDMTISSQFVVAALVIQPLLIIRYAFGVVASRVGRQRVMGVRFIRLGSMVRVRRPSFVRSSQLLKRYCSPLAS